MGSLGWEVSALGFGAMRFPLDEKSRLMEEESIRMIRYALVGLWAGLGAPWLFVRLKLAGTE